jgi:ribonuclease P protein component
MRQGFPKSQRLLKRKEFRFVYDTGTKYRNAGFHLFVKPREDADPSRLGLTATRSLGGSVVRNRLRRWARETYRLAAQGVEPGFDVVVNYHRGLATMKREAFDRLFRDVLQRAHLLKS